MSYFSVVIPTRNRIDLLRDCLQSVLLQNFKDVEVIVSDNSTNDSTKHLIESEFKSKNIKYIRPESDLCMPDHWEFAFNYTSGEYVIYLTDRSVLKKDALETIHNHIVSKNETEAVNVVSWRWDLFDDDLLMLSKSSPTLTEGIFQKVSSEKILNEYLGRLGFFSYQFPRALNVCFRRSYGLTLKERIGRLFKPLAPDNSFAFSVLIDLKMIHFIDQSLFISRGLKESSGGKHYFNEALSYYDSLGPEGQFKYTTLSGRTVENGHYEDYLRNMDFLKKIQPLSHEQRAIYFVKCYLEIFAKSNSRDSQIKDNARYYMADWQKKIVNEAPEVQTKVQNEIKKLGRKKIAIYMQALSWPRDVVHKLRYVKALLDGRVYKNALTAANYEN